MTHRGAGVTGHTSTATAAAVIGFVLAAFLAAETPAEPPPGTAGAVSRAQLLVRAARAAVELREWDRALERFAEALEEEPENADLRAEYAGVLFRSGRAGQALEEYERVLHEHPDRTDVLDAAVDAAMTIRDYDRALKRLLAYPSELRSAPAYRLRLARAYAAVKEPAKAAPLYAALAKEHPERRDIRREHLAALAAAGDWQGFATHAAAYIERWPKDPTVRLLRVDALLRQDRMAEARAELESIGALPEAPAAVWLRLADVRMACGADPADVRAMLESVANARPSPEISARIAVLLAHEGRFHDAFARLERAAMQGAPDDLLRAARAEVFALGGMHRTALAMFDPLIRRDRATARALKGSAVAALALRRSEAAKAALRRAVIRFPGDVDATYRYVSLLEERGELNEALRIVNALLEERPDNPTARLLRARLAEKAGDAAGAQADYRFVADLLVRHGPDGIVAEGLIARNRLDLVPASVWRLVRRDAPDRAAVRAALASALYREGRLADAVAAWEEALALAPDEPRYRLGLVESLAARGLSAVPRRRRRVLDEVAPLIDAEGLAHADRARLATLLVKLERWRDVLRVAGRMASERPDDGHAVALLAGALMALGRQEEAEEAMRGYLARTPENVVARYRLWMELAAIARSGEAPAALAASNGLRDLLRAEPTNADVLMALGRLWATCRQYPEAREYLNAVLALVPEDAEALLWLARVESWDARYREATAYYERYAAANPADRTVRLERARVFGWALQYDRALAEYTRAIAEERAGGAPGAETTETARALCLEREAKRLNWSHRERRAARFYDELLTLRADDPELLFDRAQIETRLGFSRRAADLYERTLLVAPGHTQAADALDYERHRANGSLSAAYAFRKEDGFGKAFDIEEHLLSLTAWTPELWEWWDLFWIGARVESGWFRFDGFPDPHVRRGRVMARKRFYNGLQLDLWYQRARYSEIDTDSDNWGVEARYEFADLIETTLSYAREDIAENYPTLAADRQRDLFKLALGADIARRWRADAFAALVHVDDGNHGRRARADLSYEIFTYPTILKLACGAEYWDYDRQGRTYFAPDDFWQFGPSLHWRHYLNRDRYSGANELYYGLKVPLLFDDDGEPYFGLGLEFLWDLTHQWQLGADVSLTRSDPYDGTFGSVRLRYRF